MNLEKEIDYHRDVPELRESVESTSEEKFREYAEAPSRDWKPLHRFLGYIHESHPRTILELGCGAGQLTTRLAKAGYHVTGLELSPELLAATRERAELDGVTSRVVAKEANIEAFEPGNERFDLVAAKLVLHHVDVEKAVSMMTRVLKPDGVAVIWEPVAFSSTLQRLRELTPVKKDISPNERQLNRDDLDFIAANFEETQEELFYCFGRAQRLLPASWRTPQVLDTVERIDTRLIRGLPFLKHFAGSAVLCCRTPRIAGKDGQGQSVEFLG